MKTKNLPIFLCLLFFLSLQCIIAVAFENENRTESGLFVIESPTLINLGFEWYIRGDDNHNAVVQVAYRKKGEGAWHPPLFL